jgi:hypothetical protein
MSLVLVVLLFILGLGLWNVPASTEFGLARLTSVIIPAMAHGELAPRSWPADPGDL